MRRLINLFTRLVRWGKQAVVEKEALNLILQDLPESIVATIFCFVFLNFRFSWKQTLIIILLQTLTNLVEVLPIAFGIRTIILMISLVVYLRAFTKTDISKVFLAVFSVFLLDAAGDAGWSLLLLRMSGLSYAQAYNNAYLRALFSYPSLASILVVTYFVYRYRKHKVADFR